MHKPQPRAGPQVHNLVPLSPVPTGSLVSVTGWGGALWDSGVGVGKPQEALLLSCFPGAYDRGCLARNVPDLPWAWDPSSAPGRVRMALPRDGWVPTLPLTQVMDG